MSRLTPPVIRRHQTPGTMIPVSLSDAWYILGVRGSGKTMFAKRLLRELSVLYPRARLYVLDSKGGDDFEHWPGVVTSEEAPKPLARPGTIQVWRPPVDDVYQYDQWIENILKARHPAAVYIDELSSLATGVSTTSYRKALPKLMKQGRSLGIAPIVLSQEGAGIPRTVKNQASHFVYFRLSPDDTHGIKQACKLLRLPVPRDGELPPEPDGRYGFYHIPMLPTPGEPIEYRDLQEFFEAA